jgi:hypothetical protein
VRIYLDPSGDVPHVYDRSGPGNIGWTQAVQRGEHVHLGSVPGATDPASLGRWLETQADDLAAIAALHADRDAAIGGIGSPETTIDAFAEAVRAATAHGTEVAHRWQAADYLYPVRDVVVDEVRAAGVDAVVDHYVSAAAQDDMLVDIDDLRDEIQALWDAAQ